MSRIVYVNGAYLPEEEATISVFDRGFLFADGVYEVSTILDGKLVDNQAHMTRLLRSLNELGIGLPLALSEIEAIQQKLLEKNNVKEGGLYLQITRGVADRDFLYPSNVTPSLVLFTQSRPVIDTEASRNGISVILQPDLRWLRRDIKTVGLLAASMAKAAAKDAGADDAWFVENGFVTEGTSNNAHIITSDNILVTKACSNRILHGITRKAVLTLAKEANLIIEERDFSPFEAKQAKEAFITSASSFVTPVIRIDDIVIGDGRPGEHTQRLRNLYINYARQSI